MNTLRTYASIREAEINFARESLFRPVRRTITDSVSSDSIALRVRRKASGAGRSLGPRMDRFIHGPLSLAGGLAFFALLAFVMWGPV